jgi:CHAT domain-containing protein
LVLISFLVCGCASTPGGRSASTAATAISRSDEVVLRDRAPGTVKADWAKPLERLANRYNTTNWSYGAAIDIDRDLARASDSNAAPVETRIRARIALAYNLIAVGKPAEARAELEDAQAALQKTPDQLSPVGRRLLEVDLIIGQAVLRGAEGVAARDRAEVTRSPRLGAGYASQARQAFGDAVMSARRAVAKAALPLPGIEPIGGAATDEAGGVRLEPEQTNVYNEHNDRLGLGDIVARPMTDGEKLLALEIRARFAQAAAELADGQLAQAGQTNATARAQMRRLPPSAAKWLRAELAAQQAEILLAQNDPAAAQATITAALKLVREDQGQSGLESFLERELSRAAEARGDLVLAKAAESDSFQILTDRYEDLHPERSDLGHYLGLLAPAAAAGDARDTARLFEVASVAVETETAHAVQDMAARFSTGEDATGEALRAMQLASYRLRNAQARLARIHAAELPPGADLVRRAENDELSARQALHERTLAFEKVAGARAGAVLNPLTTPAALQAVLRPKEAYIRYLFLDDGTPYALLVSRDGIKAFRLPTSRADLENEVLFFRASAQDADPHHRRFDRAGAYGFYRKLFGPMEAELGRYDALVIEPAGPLFGAPFGALVTRAPTARPASADDDADTAWLARDKVLELSVSAAGFVRLRGAAPSHAPRPVLAFADPTPLSPARAAPAATAIARARVADETAEAVSASTGEVLDSCAEETRALLAFPPLPDTRAEARAAVAALGGQASDMVVGADFTDTAVRGRSDLNQYRMILFATHAALPRAGACWRNPFLFTTLGAPPLSQGVLETGEIAQLSLDADLVVLSACNTGGADSAGQALGGLAQSFLFAGARGVVVSHWEADSRATAALMRRFYARLGTGAAPPAALAQAQRELMRTAGFTHPYYWALFASVGGAPID